MILYFEIKYKDIGAIIKSSEVEKIAREVALKPHLNAGVFSLASNAPHWKVWRQNLEESLKSGKVWGSDRPARAT